MIDDMGIFRTTVEVAPCDDPDRRAVVENVMVDTGSEYNWLPEAVRDGLGIVPVRIERFEPAETLT